MSRDPINKRNTTRRLITSSDPFAHRAIDSILESDLSLIVSKPPPLSRARFLIYGQDPIMRCTVDSGGSSCSHLPALASAERSEKSTCWSVIRDSSWLRTLLVLDTMPCCP